MKKVFLIFLLLVAGAVYSQEKIDFNKYIDSLIVLENKINYGSNDFVRFEASEIFKKTLIFLLSHEGAINIDFKKVKSLSSLMPESKEFRIFTWCVPLKNGSFEFYGVLLALNQKTRKYVINELEDVKKSIPNIELKDLRKNQWYGCYYYDIIPSFKSGRRYYTLLGWDGNDAFSQKKIIDVIEINLKGEPIFGASIFSGKWKHNKRIIFEYSKEANMVLRYDKQYYYVEKVKQGNQKSQSHPTGRSETIKPTKEKDKFVYTAKKVEDNNKNKGRRKSSKMIVFDRLAPLNNSLENVYQFYVPETNVVDGFIFVDGRWLYVSEVDARNPKPKNEKNTPKPVKSKIPALY